MKPLQATFARASQYGREIRALSALCRSLRVAAQAVSLLSLSSRELHPRLKRPVHSHNTLPLKRFFHDYISFHVPTATAGCPFPPRVKPHVLQRVYCDQ